MNSPVNMKTFVKNVADKVLVSLSSASSRVCVDASLSRCRLSNVICSPLTLQRLSGLLVEVNTATLAVVKPLHCPRVMPSSYRGHRVEGFIVASQPAAASAVAREATFLV